MVEKKEELIKFNFHNTLKRMYLTPKEFFKAEKETSYQSLLRMFVLFYITYLVVVQIALIFYGEFNIINAFVAIVTGTILSVLIAFIFPGIMYLLLILLGSNKGFFNIYKAGIYTLVLWTFYSLVLFFVSLVLPFDSQGLQISLMGIQDSGEIFGIFVSFLKANPVSLISLIISLIVHIHLAVFGIKALSYFQQVSIGKASFVVILSGLILFIAQIMLVTYYVSQTGIPPV